MRDVQLDIRVAACLTDKMMGVSDDARRFNSCAAQTLKWRDSCSFIVRGRVEKANVVSALAPALLRLRGSTGRWRQSVEAGWADVTL